MAKVHRQGGHKKMKCEAIVERMYSDPGQCKKLHNLKRHRWAPTELTTKIRTLCPHHRAVVDRNGDVKTVRDKIKSLVLA